MDKEGFALVDHVSSVTDFYDDDQIRDIYQREAAALVQEITGASKVVVFDNTRRSDAKAIRGERSTREPSAVVHNDYTDASAEKRLRDILPDEADERLQHRFAIINVWRSIGGPVLTTPLALCDASSVNDDTDLVATERRAKDRIGELQLVTWNPEHRWYWFSGMVKNEAALIKTFDSAVDGRARRSIHTAFKNPRAPADAVPRESIETRTFAFFD
ncbi:MAG: methyltransferase [Betaproteobacteria bacterium]|nr:MAG: methyltransferase [Betaproteobacteria bacterium]